MKNTYSLIIKLGLVLLMSACAQEKHYPNFHTNKKDDFSFKGNNFKLPWLDAVHASPVSKSAEQARRSVTEKSSVKNANNRVMKSAYETSQRSKFSCSSWCRLAIYAACFSAASPWPPVAWLPTRFAKRSSITRGLSPA